MYIYIYPSFHVDTEIYIYSLHNCLDVLKIFRIYINYIFKKFKQYNNRCIYGCISNPNFKLRNSTFSFIGFYLLILN